MTSWVALREGLDAFIGRFPILMGAWLVIALLQQGIDLLVPESLAGVEVLISIVILAPLYAGQHRLALKAVRGERAEFRELFWATRYWGPLLFAYVLVCLLTALGLIFLIVPGVILALGYTFVLIRFTDPSCEHRAKRATEAMRESLEMTKGYRGVLFGIGFLLLIPVFVLAILFWISVQNPDFPQWVLEVVSLFSGALFLGPVQATSFMVVYDHALKHPRG